MKTTTRNANLEDLAALLQEQNARKLDVVAPATAIRSIGGLLHIAGTGDMVPDPEKGLVASTGVFRPTTVFDEGLADKLGIPLPYVRKLRENRIDLYDANVNGWLQGFRGWLGEGEDPVGGIVAPDSRKFLVRLFKGNDEESGVARALLSDSFKCIDNFDILVAVLEALKASGIPVDITGCDLSERRMYVRLNAPSVSALAPELLQNYRSPFTGQSGRDLPVVNAGVVISNSETGGGAFTVAPRVTFLVCNNGATRTEDAVRAVHLGGKLDEGVIDWSDDTRKKQVELITAKARDAVTAFLNVEYLQRIVAQTTEKAAVPVTDAAAAVTVIGKKLAFSEEQTKGILDHFIRGGDVSAGGVFQAVTSYAQTVDDPDTAFDLEGAAFRALDLAAASA